MSAPRDQGRIHVDDVHHVERHVEYHNDRHPQQPEQLVLELGVLQRMLIPKPTLQRPTYDDEMRQVGNEQPVNPGGGADDQLWPYAGRPQGSRRHGSSVNDDHLPPFLVLLEVVGEEVLEEDVLHEVVPVAVHQHVGQEAPEFLLVVGFEAEVAGDRRLVGGEEEDDLRKGILLEKLMVGVGWKVLIVDAASVAVEGH